MALIKCPACSKEVSDQADTCPACGQPIRRGFLGRAGTERTFNVGCLIVVLVIGALVVLAMCSTLVR
jgi:hypothetical protein